MVESDIREEDKRTMKAREAKANREAEAGEGMRAWAEAEARVKANIARITAKGSERAKIEAEVRLR